MIGVELGSKSCDPQHLSSMPSHGWTMSALTSRAQEEYAAIKNQESCLAGLYWRLGQALDLIRKKFEYGSWATQLVTIGIDKTRAAKARAIFQAHSSEEDVSGMTVDEAYAARRRKVPQRRGKGTAKPRLESTLRQLMEQLAFFAKQTEVATPSRAKKLISLIADLNSQLSDIEQNLQLAANQTRALHQRPVKLSALPDEHA